MTNVEVPRTGSYHGRMIPPFPPDMVVRAAKTAAVTALGGVTALVAQIELPPATDLGVFAVVALLVARYTLRQLEDYRADLKVANDRLDQVTARNDVLTGLITTRDAELREVITYAHRLALFLEASVTHLDTGELPTIPDVMKPRHTDGRG